MGDLNATGLSNRKGSTKTFHSYRITNPGTVAVATPIVISASPQTPVLIEGQIQIVGNDPNEPSVGLGTTTAATELVPLTATAVPPYFIPANNSVGKVVATSPTTIYIIESGVSGNEAIYNVLVTSRSINISPV